VLEHAQGDIMMHRLMTSGWFPNSLLYPVFRRAVKATSGRISYSPELLVETMAVDRPNYAYCLLGAARLAQLLGEPRISAIEFGVAGGNGLAFMCSFAKRVEKATGVAIDCYGFDTGEGMPDPQGAKDLPYWFKAAQYRMDEGALRARLPEAKLVIGNIDNTIVEFVEKYHPAPIGAIMNDTDYWSSTLQSFRLFDSVAAHPECFLPRQFLYFDDIIGSDVEMYCDANGQLAAIADFNANHADKAIHRNQNLMPYTHRYYRWQIYYAHLFAHPRYYEYIGGTAQDKMEAALKLRRDAEGVTHATS
jgi:hypothetical protein